MGTDGLKNVLGRLRQTLLPPNGGGLTDGQLLACFLADREEAAFAALVHRHGPMVLGVCRRILGHAQDAEDAFQATFLVLARKAASVVRREALAGFLYGVAYRTALRAKARAVRRQATERQMDPMPHPEVAPAEAQDWRPLLDRELDLLPASYRTAVILCDLEGKTRRQAARQLGLSEGTLSSRLARARRLLARRLGRYGLLLSGGALAATLAEGAASAAVPSRLAGATIKAATAVAVGQTAGVATPATVLMNEVLKAMLMTKLKFYGAVGLVAVLLGMGGLAFQAVGQAPPAAGRRTETRPLTDLEILHREVEILKLQVEVLQEKLRAQQDEVRALKGQVGAGPRGGGVQLPGLPGAPGMGPTAGMMPPMGLPGTPATGAGRTPGSPGGSPPGRVSADDAPAQPGAGKGPPAPGGMRLGPGLPPGGDVRKRAATALKALLDAPDDQVVRRRAIEAMKRALQDLEDLDRKDPGRSKAEQQALEALERALQQLQERAKPEKPKDSPD
jgi:RNA polymerase sigma factor (sigma-70 family)